MANIFLSEDFYDVETALLLEKAIQCDLGKLNPRHENAVAFTDGEKVFVNSDEQLARILPAYNYGMLKWLLWHEEYHKLLKHHNRFFKYLKELDEAKLLEKFHITKEEVNVIMDILVHDIMMEKFPELVETAVNNLAQLRFRNSLRHTFKTHTLEEMLDEYKEVKKENSEPSAGNSNEDKEPKDKDKQEEDNQEGKGKSKKKQEDEQQEENNQGGDPGTKEQQDGDEPAGGQEQQEDDRKDHGKGGKSEGNDEEENEGEAERNEHDETDWSQLDKQDSTEFIEKQESRRYIREINELKNKKIKLGQLTRTLNGLATTTRERTYRMPSYINVGRNVMLKGKFPGKTSLCLVFDASGSMGIQLSLFKKIISESIPHAMDCPCKWFSGWTNDFSKLAKVHVASYEYQDHYHYDDYYDGKFSDIMTVHANNGYGDDGDRTIALCLEAEQQGLSPIGVTDGGGRIRYPNTLKKLKKTILVGQEEEWLEEAKKINPAIQTLYIPEDLD